MDYVEHNRLQSLFTLTYRDKDLPAEWSDCKKQLETFLRRLKRSSLAASWPEERAFPYLAVISRNGEQRRFHLHLALPAGFDQDLIESIWGLGMVTKDGHFEQEELRGCGGYLVKNIRESADLRPTNCNRYHLAAGCQPPVEKESFNSPEAQEAYFRYDETISTQYWQPAAPEGWGNLKIRWDASPFVFPNRGRVVWPTSIPERRRSPADVEVGHI